MTQVDAEFFVIGSTLISFALGSVMAIAIALLHFFLKGRRGDAYTLKSTRDY